MNTFEAQSVHKRYNHLTTQLHVLKGVDLTIRPGELLSIVGPSGAGKSTLLHILGGLDRPDEGHVLFAGEDVYRLDERRRAEWRNKKIGFIFQFYHLLPEFSALENVILPQLVGKTKEDIRSLKARGTELLSRVGLQARLDHKPSELSGGEQQRAAIARAVINDPEIIFCDEPTGNLDSESGEMVIDLLEELNRKSGKALVIVTHDSSIAERSHRVIRMRDGKFIET